MDEARQGQYKEGVLWILRLSGQEQLKVRIHDGEPSICNSLQHARLLADPLPCAEDAVSLGQCRFPGCSAPSTHW
jgi:hypothetical protein